MKLLWDQIGEREFETGVEKCVLYPFNVNTNSYGKGSAWSGITGVTESPSGAEASPFYADNQKYLNLFSAEDFGATVTAYTYTDEVKDLDGTRQIAPGVRIGQQSRGMFAMCYQTKIGNDTRGTDLGVKYHFIYNATMSPSEKAYATENESPAPIEFSWTLTTTPVQVTGYKPTASLTIESPDVDPEKLAALEAVIYGTDGTVSYNEVTSPTGNPATNGYYERSGSVGSYIYTASVDSTVESGKTYYEKVTVGGTEPRIPLPDEIADLLGDGAQG